MGYTKHTVQLCIATSDDVYDDDHVCGGVYLALSNSLLLLSLIADVSAAVQIYKSRLYRCRYIYKLDAVRRVRRGVHCHAGQALLFLYSSLMRPYMLSLYMFVLDV